MKPVFVFLILLCVIGLLWRIVLLAAENRVGGVRRRTDGRKRRGPRPLLPPGRDGRISGCLPMNTKKYKNDISARKSSAVFLKCIQTVIPPGEYDHTCDEYIWVGTDS